ncbi:glycosyltransferase family 4 protein [Bacteroides sp. 224]|uniref:MraY family glycosyltransferase n=1 Tax=Bacteroides sp. 224 TaxID=2302936 RepID=UPI0013D477A1|nr:glycosyltransferase family 4 protein [Bacteroides sp. 224]NDV64961.1 UDP-GlcNAc--UDP-phosphate GlcNAc-1-phosphate transferase [Bacteroides sp. 224]
MYFIILFVLLFLAELLYFKIADKYNIIDKPNERSSHTRITLRGGGIIFYLGAITYSLSTHFAYPWFMIGLTLITIISFIDDIRSVSQKIRLVFHFVGMGFMFYQWGALESQWTWWYMIIATVFCIGIINAYNFMDGINGITGGYSLIVLLALGYINEFIISFIDNRFIGVLILAIMVFNFFNFRKKAKCFAGDVGSISIAFTIVFLIGQLILVTHDFSYIILLVVYGVDSILTIVHRILLHENIGLPHRKHLYQILANELKMPHIAVSTIYMCIQTIIIAGFVMVHSYGYGYYYLLATILLLSLVYVLFMKSYFYLHLNKSEIK